MAKYRVKREPVVQPQDQSIKIIPLTHAQVTIIDTCKYEWAMQNKWGAKWDETIHGYYARAGIGYMHRLLLEAKPEERVDHHNGNTLDNRLENLRKVTLSQSAQNRKVRCTSKSGYAGIYWIEKRIKWRVEITVNKKRIHIGEFINWDIAFAARIAAEHQYFGEFALSNRHVIKTFPH